MKDICFDLYGTLLDIRTDEESPQFWAEISKLLSGKRSGDQLKERYRALCAEEQEKQRKQEFDLLPVFERMLQEYAHTATTEQAEAFAQAFRKASVIKCRPFAGIPEMLNGLKERGIRLYLLSNAQTCFTRAELRESGLDIFFDGIMLSSEIGWKKPSTQFFQTAFTLFGLDPTQSVYVGNDLHDDVLGAKGVGMQTVYIPTEQSGVYEDMPSPDITVSSVKELSEILFKI